MNWSVEPLGELACLPQEVLDNMTDKGHLQPVHGSIDMVKFENEFDGHVCRQILTAGHKTLAGAGVEPMTNDTWYTGPGILQSVMIGEYPSHMLITHTPVDDGVIKVWYGLFVKVKNDVPTAADIELAKGYEKAGVAAFAIQMTYAVSFGTAKLLPDIIRWRALTPVANRFLAGNPISTAIPKFDPSASLPSGMVEVTVIALSSALTAG